MNESPGEPAGRYTSDHGAPVPPPVQEGWKGPGVIAPPTRPGAREPGSGRARWPTVLGIFAIVIGALGILTRLGGLLSIAVFSAVTTAFEDVEASGFLAEKWLAWSILEYSLGLVLAIVLLVGGIGLVQRRWWSAALAVGWAWAKIFFVVGESILAFYMQRDQIQAAGAGPVGVWAGPMAFFFGVVPILIIGLAFPIICLSVLLLGSSKKEVSTWRGAGSGGRGDTVIR